MSQTISGTLVDPLGNPIINGAIYCCAVLPTVIAIGGDGISVGTEAVIPFSRATLGVYSFVLENGTYKITIQVGSSTNPTQNGYIVVNNGTTTDILTALATQAPPPAFFG